MEILKGFSFDIQRFALDWSAGAYYVNLGNNLDGTTALDVSSIVNVHATLAAAAKLTYKTGTSVEHAKVTIDNAKDVYFILTEGNSGDSAEDTVIRLT